MVADRQSFVYKPVAKKKKNIVLQCDSPDDDIGLVWLFTKHSFIILQAVLPRRADPTELKAIFEKVGFDLYVFVLFFEFA